MNTEEGEIKSAEEYLKEYFWNPGWGKNGAFEIHSSDLDEIIIVMKKFVKDHMLRFCESAQASSEDEVLSYVDHIK